MPENKPIPSLVRLSLKRLPSIVKSGVSVACEQLVDKWYKVKQTNHTKVRQRRREPVEQVLLTSGRVREGEEQAFSGDLADTVLEYEHREQFDQYETSHVELDTDLTAWTKAAVLQLQTWLEEAAVPGLVNHIMEAVLKGLEEAMVEKNTMLHKQDTPAGMAKINTQMCIIISFLDCITSPVLSVLNVTLLLQTVRNYLYTRLDKFTGLRQLNLGEGSHGYVPELYRNYFLSGVSCMKSLVKFSLHCDSFDQLLQQLASSCSSTLQSLDIEGSILVTDISVSYISEMKRLVELNMFSCGLTSEGQARVLINLPHLVDLRRGDFLCDAVEWIAWWPEAKDKRLKVREFYSSESYHFHTQDQMELVSEYCPNISKMRFMFSKEHFIEFTPLQKFKNLRELNICGGDFYGDNLVDLLEVAGHQLTSLDLYYIDQLDLKAVALMSVYCRNLSKLTFSNCGFKSIYLDTTDNVDSYERQLQARDQPVIELMQPMPSLQRLSVSSSCCLQYVSLLVTSACNLEELELGVSIDVNDQFICEMLCHVPSLKRLNIRGSERDDLTIQTSEMLLDSCPSIREITDLRAWLGVYPREVDQLQNNIRKYNWDLYLGEDMEKDTEEALRRAGLKEKFDRLREQFGDMVMIP